MDIKLMIPYAYLVLSLLIGLIETPERAVAETQQPLFELPVQLIGFPVIVIAVRIANFVKKLAYSLNPQTYMARNKRSPGAYSSHAFDMYQVERRIRQEFGPKVCILEDPCRHHATRKAPKTQQPDWIDILRNYKSYSDGTKQWYLLSVFLGEEIKDVHFCKQLAKRLPCSRNDTKYFVQS